MNTAPRIDVEIARHFPALCEPHRAGGVQVIADRYALAWASEAIGADLSPEIGGALYARQLGF